MLTSAPPLFTPAGGPSFGNMLHNKFSFLVRRDQGIRQSVVFNEKQGLVNEMDM